MKRAMRDFGDDGFRPLSRAAVAPAPLAPSALEDFPVFLLRDEMKLDMLLPWPGVHRRDSDTQRV